MVVIMDFFINVGFNWDCRKLPYASNIPFPILQKYSIKM